MEPTHNVEQATEHAELTRVARIEHEADHVEQATNNRAIVELLTAAENIVLTSVAILLIVLAAMLLINGGALLVNAVVTSSLRDHVLDVLDTILLVAVVMEIVYTVTLSLRSHELSAEPFLVVGIIAAIRRILEITIRIGSATVTGTEGTAASNAMAAQINAEVVNSLLNELALLALIVISLAVSTFLIRRSNVAIKLPSHPDSPLHAS